MYLYCPVVYIGLKYNVFSLVRNCKFRRCNTVIICLQDTDEIVVNYPTMMEVMKDLKGE